MPSPPTDQRVVSPVRYTALCRVCKRDIEAHAMTRANGRVIVELRCPKCGTARKGKRTLYKMGYVPVDDDATPPGTPNAG